MRQGRLFIDDRWVEVGAADRQRLSDYDREARAMMPLAARIGQDAADIAFTALGQVAKGISLHHDAADPTLAQARAELHGRVARSNRPPTLNGDAHARNRRASTRERESKYRQPTVEDGNINTY